MLITLWTPRSIVTKWRSRTSCHGYNFLGLYVFFVLVAYMVTLVGDASASPRDAMSVSLPRLRWGLIARYLSQMGPEHSTLLLGAHYRSIAPVRRSWHHLHGCLRNCIHYMRLIVTRIGQNFVTCDMVRCRNVPVPFASKACSGSS